MTCKRNEVTAVFGGADGGLAVLMGADAAETVCGGCVGAPGKRGASGHAFALRLPRGVGHTDRGLVGCHPLASVGPVLPPRDLPAPTSVVFDRAIGSCL